jgi:predicted PurR-regulated permease PerM
MRVDTLRPYFLLVILLAALALVVLIFKPFLAPLALAAVFAVVLRPVYNWLLARLGNNRTVAGFSTLLVAAVGLLVPLGLIATQIVAEASSLYVALVGTGGLSGLQTLAAQMSVMLSNLIPGVSFNAESIIANLGSYTQQILQWLVSHFGSIVSGATGFVLDLFIFFMALYFLLKDGPALKRVVVELSPLVDSDDDFIFGRLGLAINSVVRGSLFVALIQGVIATVGYLVFGVPNAVLWGTATAFSALIPGVGTSLVLIPVVLYLVVTGSLVPAFGLFIWGAVAVGLIDNLLGPRLIGRGARLHPLLILLSVLGGIIFFGPAGIFLGPLSVSLFLAILSIHAHTLKEKSM